MRVRWTRIGPVFLHWSEDPDSGAQVIGWGGDDLYHCDACPSWADGYDEALDHARVHGFYGDSGTGT